MTEVGQGMGKQSLISGHSVHGHFNAYRVACLISQYLAISRCMYMYDGESIKQKALKQKREQNTLTVDNLFELDEGTIC